MKDLTDEKEERPHSIFRERAPGRGCSLKDGDEARTMDVIKGQLLHYGEIWKDYSPIGPLPANGTGANQKLEEKKKNVSQDGETCCS